MGSPALPCPARPCPALPCLRRPALTLFVYVVLPNGSDLPVCPALGLSPLHGAAFCSEEEVSFNRTLDKGIARFKKAAAAAKAQGQKDIDSKDAFEMWDTYGFPVDLTQVPLRACIFDWSRLCT